MTMRLKQVSTSEKWLPTRCAFLVVPGFSMIAYAAAVDTLRMANRMAEKTLYEWETLSLGGQAVCASSGLEVAPKGVVSELPQFCGNEIVFVCGGLRVDQAWSIELGRVLRGFAKQKVVLGSLCTGTYLLAKAGLLDGYRCTIHWERLASTREEFPSLKLSDDIYELDRNRYTCAGGTTPIDMMMHLISLDHGKELAAAISEEFLLDRIRSSQDRQRIPLRQQIGTSQPKLTEAVVLMEANIEEPLTPDELAHCVMISRRQLERLFRAYLDCTPTHYYLGLRLRNARRLLLQTEHSIVEVSLACGFTSAPHFSKCYRDLFGQPPRDARRLLKV